MNNKSLKDISWQVTEPEYRADPALSYSILAKYEREGFEKLDHLFDSVDSPSLTFGSAVDTLITDGEQAFNNRFLVTSFPPITPQETPIVNELFEQFGNQFTDINSIPDSGIMQAIEKYGFQKRWKLETRINAIKADCAKYYQVLFMAKGKTILDQETYDRIFACYRALKDSPQTHTYFCDNNPFDGIERLYQLKFKQNLTGIDYRCMADLIVVNHKAKTVTPVDLKTSSKPEYNFYKSFLDWRYDIQAKLYWRLIRKTMDSDPIFKDYKLANYRFVTVSSTKDPEPLIWLFEDTKSVVNLEYETPTETISLRDPEVIGRELKSYLDNKPTVPNGIYKDKPNSICNWIKNGGLK